MSDIYVEYLYYRGSDLSDCFNAISDFYFTSPIVTLDIIIGICRGEIQWNSKKSCADLARTLASNILFVIYTVLQLFIIYIILAPLKYLRVTSFKVKPTPVMGLQLLGGLQLFLLIAVVLLWYIHEKPVLQPGYVIAPRKNGIQLLIDSAMLTVS